MAPRVGRGLIAASGVSWRGESEASAFLRSFLAGTCARTSRNVHVRTGPLYTPGFDSGGGELHVRYKVIGTAAVSVPTRFFGGK